MLALTVYTLLEDAAAIHGEKPALRQPIGGGKYRTYTWAEARDMVQWAEVGLHAGGAKKAISSRCNRRTKDERRKSASVSARKRHRMAHTPSLGLAGESTDVPETKDHTLQNKCQREPSNSAWLS